MMSITQLLLSGGSIQGLGFMDEGSRPPGLRGGHACRGLSLPRCQKTPKTAQARTVLTPNNLPFLRTYDLNKEIIIRSPKPQITCFLRTYDLHKGIMIRSPEKYKKR